MTTDPLILIAQGGRATFLLALGLSLSTTLAMARFIVTVNNESGAARAAEMITVPYDQIAKAFPGIPVDHLAVQTSDGTIVPSQLLNFLPEEHRDNYRAVIFQHDFAAGEATATFTIEDTRAPIPPYPTRVFARYVPERFDDFAWENDRIAHRVYGPTLATATAGRDRMTSSGIDVWCKRVSYPVIDRWYLKGHYHEDTGEGLDMYDVGTARGCGGTGVWDGKRIIPAGNWSAWKVLANGPIRAVFELSYAPFEVEGRRYTEVKRFTVDAGHNFDQVEDTFTFEGNQAQTIAIGLTKHKGTVATAHQDQANGWTSRWETFKRNGSLGCGVRLAPGETVAGWAETDSDQVLLVKVSSGAPLHYAIGAGWTLSAKFSDAASWENYIVEEAAQARNPLTVTIHAQ